jgi:hypothetical protein
MIKFFRTLFCMPDNEIMYLKLLSQRLTEIENDFKTDSLTHELPNPQ